MIKSLRKRIFFTIVICLTVGTLLLLVGICAFRYQQNRYQSLTSLERYATNHIASDIPSQTKQKNDSGNRKQNIDTTLLSSFTLNSDGNIADYHIGDNVSLEESKLRSLVASIQKGDSNSGTIDHISYYRTNKDAITQILLLDSSRGWEEFISLLFFSLIILAVATLVFCILGHFLANKIVTPVEDAFNKQREFISDASHELKTPLAVIMANSNLLESEMGDNKWLQYIHSETDRMNQLIERLLSLARTEASDTTSMERFDLSNAVLHAALPYESIAYESGIEYEINVAPNLSLHGNSDEIQQVVAIFLDNAMKHTPIHGTITLSLEPANRCPLQHTHCHCHLYVENTGSEIAKEDQSRIFDRFYRVDKVRNRSEGRYGLGLAIAKSIIESHKGYIHVQSADMRTRFNIWL